MRYHLPSVPHLCSVCFITFMDSTKANYVLENFDTKLRLRKALPPPGWDKTQHFWWTTEVYFCKKKKKKFSVRLRLR